MINKKKYTNPMVIFHKKTNDDLRNRIAHLN